MGTRNRIDSVLGVLNRVPTGRLLDLPAGDGRLMTAAKQAGWQTFGADLFANGLPHSVCADACENLPFLNGAFDAVISMEGIEHFENQAHFVRECSRVLRPGGILVITTPNVLHLSARFSTFFTGQRLMRNGVINEIQTCRDSMGDRFYHGHAFLIDVIRLRYLLALAGTRIIDVLPTNWSTTSRIVAPLAPLIRLAMRWTLWAGRRTHGKGSGRVTPPEVEKDLLRWSTHRSVLFSRGLIVVALKTERGHG